MNGARGGGLIELIVGLSLIAVAILGLNSLAAAMIRGHLSAQLSDEAARLAQAKMERVRHDGYDAAAPGTTVELVPSGGNGSTLTFKRSTEIGAGALAGVRAVTVTMAWWDGGARHAIFDTEIAR